MHRIWIGFISVILVIGIGFFYFSNSDSQTIAAIETLEDCTIEGCDGDNKEFEEEFVEEIPKPPALKVLGDKTILEKENVQIPPLSRKWARGDRHPPQLKPDQIYFKVVEGGYAITSGDILLGKVNNEQKDIKHGFSVPEKSKLWESSEIPFQISQEILNQQPIQDAIDYFAKHTPIRFVEAISEDKDILIFIPAKEHCASHIGRVGGLQPILISPDCGSTEVMHELMHALGFIHEHSREDRDNFIKVNWENIQEDFLSQFNKSPPNWVHNYSGSVFHFDSQSIMLYPENAFAKSNKLKTIESLGVDSIAPVRNQLSRRDRERLYYLYGN